MGLIGSFGVWAVIRKTKKKGRSMNQSAIPLLDTTNPVPLHASTPLPTSRPPLRHCASLPAILNMTDEEEINTCRQENLSSTACAGAAVNLSQFGKLPQMADPNEPAILQVEPDANIQSPSRPQLSMDTSIDISDQVQQIREEREGMREAFGHMGAMETSV